MAEESGTPAGHIEIVDTLWRKGDAAVMEAIKRQINDLVARTVPPTEQLPDPEA